MYSRVHQGSIGQGSAQARSPPVSTLAARNNPDSSSPATRNNQESSFLPLYQPGPGTTSGNSLLRHSRDSGDSGDSSASTHETPRDHPRLGFLRGSPPLVLY